MEYKTVKKVYIAGHTGMVGSAVRKALEDRYHLVWRSSRELDLRDQQATHAFMAEEKPDIVIDAAAKAGGIWANSQFPYLFLMENLQIQTNLIDASLRNGVEKFIFLGSSCVYPKLAPQPIREEYLLTSSLEPTNEWYAIAKISGIKACEAIRRQFGKNYISLMPTNLYGPNDNFDLKSSHVLPSMIRKFHEAKEMGHCPVKLWGSGSPFREFMHVDDLADAILFSIENTLQDHLYNVGTGQDLSIKELARVVQAIVGHRGEVKWDHSMPDGTPRKLLDVSKLKAAGWRAQIDLEDGIRSTYDWYLKNIENLKEVKLNF
jgi:GDP-L-fucose synthase